MKINTKRITVNKIVRKPGVRINRFGLQGKNSLCTRQRQLSFAGQHSDVRKIKYTGGTMRNRQLKAVTKVIRSAGVDCPSMKDYYDEHQSYCDDVFEKYISDIRKTCVVLLENS